MTLSAASVDITSGSPKIGVEIQFQAPGLLKQAYVNFLNEAGDRMFGYVDLAYPSPLPSYSGGTFSREIFLAPGRAPGVWQVTVELTDQNNLRTIYGGTGNTALPAGSSTSVTLQNTGVADTQPPVLISGSVTPDPVESGSSEQDITLTVEVSDDREMSDIRVELVPPSGATQYYTLNASTIVAGNRQSGTWRRTAQLPAFSPGGEWKIRYSIFDRSKRGKTYGQGGAALPEAAQASLTVNSSTPGDVAGPLVTAISFSRSSVDVTDATQQVVVNLTLHDTPAGLRGGRLYLINPQGENTLDIPFFSASPPYPVTPEDDLVGATVPRYIAPGVYRWRVVGLDGQARESIYGFGGQPFPGGVSDQLTVQNTGPVEAARPVLVSYTITPGEINPADFPASVTVSARVTDDVETNRVEFHLQDPDYPTQKSTRFLSLTSGTARDGVWSATFNIGASYKPGSYKVGFSVYDRSSVFGVDYGPYGGVTALPLPAGSPEHVTILSHHGEGHAYGVWRSQYPALAGASGEPGADHDGDNLANVVEFLCGTDPLLNSASTATDPAAERAPRVVPKPGYLRMEYRLSAANAALGTGNVYRLEPQATPSFKTPWTTNVPQGKVANTDLYWAELPVGVPALFLRVRVTP